MWRDAQGATGTTNLTDNAQAPKAAGNPFAYVDTARNTVILLYRSGDGVVRSLYWSTGAVGADNLSGTAGAPKTAGDPVGYYTAHDDTHHVIYRTSDGRLHEIWSTPGGGTPQHTDLTDFAAAPPAADRPAAFTVEGPGTQHVAYRGPSNHIYEVIW